jgi:hypothetical protein
MRRKRKGVRELPDGFLVIAKLSILSYPNEKQTVHTMYRL